MAKRKTAGEEEVVQTEDELTTTETEQSEPGIEETEPAETRGAGDEPEPEPRPTPEQEEEWERERKAREAALIAPYIALKETINEHDDLMADALYEITMLELGMEE